MWRNPDFAYDEPALGNIRRNGPIRRGELVVGVVGAPARYRRGDGPPLAPVSLLPPRDSTAYIVDRSVVDVLNEESGKLLHKRMEYLVGWTDLPLARMRIDAAKILDYVSPRELEDWEYKYLLAREDKERRDADKAADDAKRGGGRLRPGRKRKKAPEVDESMAVPLLEVPKRGRGRPKKGLGLTTPQKVRPEAFVETETDREEGYASPSQAIFNQLYGNEAGTAAGADTSEATGTGESGDDLMADEEASTSVPALKAEMNTRTATAGLKPWPLPLTLPQRASGASSPLRHLALHDSRPLHGPSKLSSPIFPPLTTTGANIHALALSNAQHQDNFHSGYDSDAMDVPKSREGTPLRSSTRAPSAASGKSSAAKLNGAPALRALSLQDQDQEQNQHDGDGEPPQKRKRMSTHSRTTTHRTKKRKRTEAKTKMEPAEDTWDVESLEDLRIYDVDGHQVRYFLVRWLGEWPPDQKTTWEPETNIPDELVSDYMAARRQMGLVDVVEPEPDPDPELDPESSKKELPKKQSSRKSMSAAATGTPKSRQQQNRAPEMTTAVKHKPGLSSVWSKGREYASVTEAFNDVEEGMSNNARADEEDNEKFVVVEVTGGLVSNTPVPLPAYARGAFC